MCKYGIKMAMVIMFATVTTFPCSEFFAQERPNGGFVLQPGSPVGSSVAPGTLALTIKRKDGSFQMLSNFHIFNRKGLQSNFKRPFIRAFNLFKKGEHDIFYNGKEFIGKGARYFDLWEKGCVYDGRLCQFDAAFAKFSKEYEIRWTNQIKNCNRMIITSSADVKVGDFVAKFGKTTRLTIGVVADNQTYGNKGLKSDLKIVSLNDKEIERFNRLYVNSKLHIVRAPSLSAPSDAGDSGSAWFLWPPEGEIVSNNKFIELNAVGLHHSGADNYSTATKINFILSALGAKIPLVNESHIVSMATTYVGSSYDLWFDKDGYELMCNYKNE